MGEVREVQLHVRGSAEPSSSSKEAAPSTNQTQSKLKQWKWWLLVSLCTISVLAGQTIATLLGRFYYNEGGNSMWMATLVQSAGSPLLIPFLFFTSQKSKPDTVIIPHPPFIKITLIYISLGLIIAGDNLMYSYALFYLPVSTYSLVCATQLAFNAIFSYFLNKQKFTPLIFNSVVLLTFSASLLGLRSDSDDSNIPKGKYPLGFVLTLGASATYSLILSLMQLVFQKVLKRETFAIVFEMQVWTNIVAALASAIGLFASGDWKGISTEMNGFEKGKVSYVTTLVGTAVSWQVCSIGVVGLIFVVSSLFSNVISTLALPIVPVFAVVFFHDKMDGVKVVAMLIAIWGFLSYMYQHYMDDSKENKSKRANAL